MEAMKSATGAKGNAPKKKTKGRPKGRPDLLGSFGPYLMLRRKRGKMSIRELARRAKSPHTNIFQFEKLRKDPRLTELDQLAKAFREPLAKFLEPLL